MDRKDKTGYTIGFVILIAIGLWAVLDPSAVEDYGAVGSRAFAKQLVADYWGPKLGVALMALGGLALFGLHQTDV